MAQYIPLRPLVTEIERRKKYNHERAYLDRSSSMAGREEEDKDILSIINALEVKEVDLDKEIEEHALCMPMSEFTNDGEVEDYLDWAREEFRHFYELGLKAQKGE